MKEESIPRYQTKIRPQPWGRILLRLPFWGDVLFTEEVVSLSDQQGMLSGLLLS